MKTILDEKTICDEYQSTNIGIEAIALKYHVGKKKINEILAKNNIPHKKKGAQRSKETFLISDWSIKKYNSSEGYHYMVYDPKTDFVSKDINNNGGVLTSYIEKEYNIPTPTLYDRRMYYMRTGNYWWEQWLSVRLVKNEEVKKCPYCDWETIDIENKSGAFEQHLLKCHNMTKLEYLGKKPSDREYFRLVNKRLDRTMETDQNKFIICKICGAHLARIDTHHLKTHNITKQEYINIYGVNDMVSKEYHNKQSKLTKILNSNIKHSFHSNDEQEIMCFLKNNGIECHTDRKILNGRELDIFIPSKNIAIEYNGNKWHTEFFGGKDKNYHLNKLEECLKNGISLIQIFEDEYNFHKDIVLSKLSHLLGISSNLQKIYARKCVIKEIDKNTAELFLDKHHIQGFASASVYIGGYFNDKLVGVMSFLKENDANWTLNRCATHNSYNCIGLCGKMFKYFIRKYEFTEIKSFADRRWTLDETNNLYTKLGFVLAEKIRPSYTYYNSSVNRYKRYHKFSFRKKLLHKKFDLPLTMTETEMIKKIGYDRIWDCGLIKYVYKQTN